MNTLIKASIERPILRYGFIPVVLVLSCFALSFPKAFGVVPAPDGGYSGFNTAEGQDALFSLTTGKSNTALGAFSLFSDTTGRANTAVGRNALRRNVEGEFNTAVGLNALFSNTTGGENTANGAQALRLNTIGTDNTADGISALENNTAGNFNTATGQGALQSNITGSNNTAHGEEALFSNNTGERNTANGSGALGNNTEGSFNTADGFRALLNNTTGNNNTALGLNAGDAITTADNVICIGANVAGFNVSDSCFIGNIRDAQVGNDAVAVMIDSFGKLGTTVSSRRFKKEIQPMAKASEAILALKPVTFHYKTDNTRTPQFGLIAEEVAAVNPNLVVRDKNGEIYSVRYDAVNAMLLNEFLKEHETVQELKKEIVTLTAKVKEQDSNIQKLSDRLQLRKPAPQLASNHQ